MAFCIPTYCLLLLWIRTQNDEVCFFYSFLLVEALIHAFFFSSFFPSPALSLLEKHAKEKSKTPAKRGAIHQRNRAWFSPTCSGERCWPSSKRTSARPKRCSWPFHSSWDWNWALLATSSWTRADAAWTNGWTRAVPVEPRPLPALVPKSDLWRSLSRGGKGKGAGAGIGLCAGPIRFPKKKKGCEEGRGAVYWLTEQKSCYWRYQYNFCLSVQIV